MKYVIGEDKSIYFDNKTIFFSLEKFINDIVKGECCFICGINPTKASFNDEHVIPEWILRKMKLFSDSITLSNGDAFGYNKYKIPCCEKCNSLLGETVEDPMSKLLLGNYEKVSSFIVKKGPLNVFVWLALIFFKVHYRDKSLREFKDLRQPGVKLSDRVNWLDMHHIHCLLRSSYTTPKIEGTVIGSLLVLPALQSDYCDNFEGKSILLRINDVCFIAILNDSCASLQMYFDELQRISGSLTALQLREIFSRLTHINALLKNRPEYFSSIDQEKNSYCLEAKLPKMIELNNVESVDYGKILDYYCGSIVKKMEVKDKEKILKEIGEGRRSFLFDENGEFCQN